MLILATSFWAWQNLLSNLHEIHGECERCQRIWSGGLGFPWHILQSSFSLSLSSAVSQSPNFSDLWYMQHSAREWDWIDRRCQKIAYCRRKSFWAWAYDYVKYFCYLPISQNLIQAINFNIKLIMILRQQYLSPKNNLEWHSLLTFGRLLPHVLIVDNPFSPANTLNTRLPQAVLM